MSVDIAIKFWEWLLVNCTSDEKNHPLDKFLKDKSPTKKEMVYIKLLNRHLICFDLMEEFVNRRKFHSAEVGPWEHYIIDSKTMLEMLKAI